MQKMDRKKFKQMCYQKFFFNFNILHKLFYDLFAKTKKKLINK